MLTIEHFVPFTGRGQVTQDHLGSGLPSPPALLICSKESLQSRAVALFCHVSFSSHSLSFPPAASPTHHWQIKQSRAWGGCQMALHGWSSYFTACLLFLSPFFFLRLPSLFSWFTFKSFSSSPFIPGSHCTPVVWEASQGRCMWHLLQHMVHLLLWGALRFLLMLLPGDVSLGDVGSAALPSKDLVFALSAIKCKI